MTNTDTDTDEWRLVDTAKDNVRVVSGRAEAEEKRGDIIALGADPEAIEILEPGETLDDESGDETDDGSQTEAEPDGGATPEPTTEPDTTAVAAETEPLPDDPPVDEDPISWMPSHFIDRIDGTPTINRKGYEVIAQHFGVGATVELVTPPEETGHEFARATATATTEDGVSYDAHASAQVDRGDDATLLTSLADTRAFKRAVRRATGVGILAAEELQNQP